jgi:hypothetical protein
MTLEDLGNLGEVVGALGVLASLAYLGIQIRQNTQALRTSTYQQLLDHIASINLAVVNAGDAGEIYATAARNGFVPGSTEHIRWRVFVLSSLRHWAHAHMQHEAGTLTDEQWKMLTHGLERVVGLPGFLPEWQALAAAYPSAFRAFIEERLAAAAALASPAGTAGRSGDAARPSPLQDPPARASP